jgi:NADH-ubiquinone oxidoreductase chain 6
MNSILLDFLACAAIFSGVLVITSKNPVSSVLFLISVFVNSAGYLVVLGVGFVALSYLIVYVGAIAILFLFVVMMLNLRLVELVEVGREYTRNLPLGTIVGATLFFEMVSVLPISFEDAASLNRLLGIYSSVQNFVVGAPRTAAPNFYENVHQAFNPGTADAEILNFTDLETIGQGLYTSGSLWLILASIVLLLGMVGPILLCLRSEYR